MIQLNPGQCAHVLRHPRCIVVIDNTSLAHKILNLRFWRQRLARRFRRHIALA